MKLNYCSSIQYVGKSHVSGSIVKGLDNVQSWRKIKKIIDISYKTIDRKETSERRNQSVRREQLRIADEIESKVRGRIRETEKDTRLTRRWGESGDRMRARRKLMHARGIRKRTDGYVSHSTALPCATPSLSLPSSNFHPSRSSRIPNPLQYCSSTQFPPY